MAIIKKLNQKTTNLIAAGEVIERPTSVVKELVENAIDANARHITISLIEAGLTEIVVTDDGDGMDIIDAKMAIEPHATSKIKNEHDLFKISSLGFRGEALPSIVSISQFRMKTSVDGNKGFMYNLKGGVLISEAIVASRKGTEISVRNLFFNTPARLQSLQSPVAELSYVTEFVGKIAIANPDISFTLINNNKPIIVTHGTGDLLETIFAVYGSDVAKAMVSVFNDDGFFQIEGFISKISVTRSSKNHITIIVNGRVIRNNNLVNAVIRAYGERLMNGRYPIAVINITLDAGLVDVNVHPAKLEVRFSNEDELIDLLIKTVHNTLKTTDLIVDVSDTFAYDKYDEMVEVEQESEDIFSEEMIVGEDVVNVTSSDLRTIDKIISIPNDEQSFQQQTYSFNDNEILDIDVKQNKLPLMTYIGQLFGTYILTQGQDDFYLIDQHAAAERVNYEKILRELRSQQISTYELLVPFKLSYTISEAILINEHINEIIQLGIGLEDFGGGTFTVRTLPVWIPKDREIDYVDEIIIAIISNKKKEKYEFQMNLARDLACKKSIKANEFHTPTEIEYLLEDLTNAENPYTCPHGRPVIIKFTKYEIEKWFKRVI